MNRDKQIDIDIAVEQMASAVRERTVACNKCEYYKEGSCLKPIDLGCNENEDILNLCDAIYEKSYRKASEVAREIFEEIEEMLNMQAIIVCKTRETVMKADEPPLSYMTMLDGRIYSIRVVEEHIAELKKKYTEGSDGT